MASPVATVTTSPFLVTATIRTAPQPEAPAEAPSPAAGSVQAWDTSLRGATQALGHAKSGGNLDVVHSSRRAVQASVAGAVAALNERLQTTEDGAAACELLATVTRAYETLAASNGMVIDRKALETMLVDFKARIAEAEKCWTKQGKTTRYRATFEALERELTRYPSLAEMVKSQSVSAWKTPGWGGSLTEYRRASARIQGDLRRAFATADANAMPLLPPPRGVNGPLLPGDSAAAAHVDANRLLLEEAGIFWQEAVSDFKEAIAAAQSASTSDNQAKAYRTAYEALGADLAPLKALTGALKRRAEKAKATTTDWETEAAAFEQLTPRVLAELERQLGALDPNQLVPLLPAAEG